MQAKKHVIVVGAGIVGVSTAIWLQRDGYAVTLIDRLAPGEATSFGNGGVLASCAVVPVTGPGLIQKAPGMLLGRDKPLFMKWRYFPKLLPWLFKYLKHANEEDTRRIASALNEIIGDSVSDHLALAEGTDAGKFIRPGDYLYVYGDRSEFEAEALSWKIRKELGFKWNELDADKLQRTVPGISGENRFGISLPGHGRITDPGAYVKSLAAYFERQGGAIKQEVVQDITLENGRFRQVVTQSGTMNGDAIVLAAGVWSKDLMAKLGIDVPMESERGYHLELWNPSWMPDMPLMLASGKFVVTPMDRRIRLAGILEFGGLDAPPSQAPFALLERQFRAAFPDVTWERSERWMGHRPAPSDSIPVIGEIETAKGVFCGFGHHHVGLTGGPKTGRLLAQIIGGKNPNIDLAPFSPMRFT